MSGKADFRTELGNMTPEEIDNKVQNWLNENRTSAIDLLGNLAQHFTVVSLIKLEANRHWLLMCSNDNMPIPICVAADLPEAAIYKMYLCVSRIPLPASVPPPPPTPAFPPACRDCPDRLQYGQCRPCWLILDEKNQNGGLNG